MHNTVHWALGFVSVLISNVIPQSIIDFDSWLQVIIVIASFHRTIDICVLYITPPDPIN